MYDQDLVQTAVEKGYVSDGDVAQAMQRQSELSDRGIERSLWLLLQDLGALRPEQARRVERHGSSDSLSALEVEGFVVQGRLGRGGMGDVFLGARPDGSEAAIKVLPPNMARDEEYLARFQREVEALRVLDHPGITGFIGAGTVDGRPYLVMELVRGQSLKERLQQSGAITEAEARQLLGQLARALDHCFRSGGLVHRDVKPANILIATGSDPLVAKLCDFGLAKFVGRRDETRIHGDLTHSGVAIGTPHYMSPEQATGDRSADPRHDIYGLGATIYHALLGKTLYSGGSSAVIMYKQATAALDMKPLSRLGIAPAFIDVLGKMLAKPRERRYPDWPSVLADVDRLELIPLAEESDGHDTGAEPRKLPFDLDEAAAGAVDQRQTTDRSVEPRPASYAGLVQIVLLVVAVISLTAGILFSYLVEEEVVQGFVTGPATVGETIRAARESLARHGPPVVVRLEPGSYTGGWTFTAVDSGLQLLGGDEVVIRAPRDKPILVLDEGLQDFRAVGLRLVGATGVAIESRADQAVLRSCSVTDCYVVLDQQRGHLVLDGLRAWQCGRGLTVSGKAELDCLDSLLQVRAEHLRADDAAISLRRVRLQASGGTEEPVLQVTGGVLTARGLIIAGHGTWTGIRLQGVGLAQLSELAIEGGRVGIEVIDSAVPILQGCSIEVAELALRWQGAAGDREVWRRLRLQAPQRVLGLEEAGLVDAIDGIGADPEALAGVPDQEAGKK